MYIFIYTILQSNSANTFFYLYLYVYADIVLYTFVHVTNFTFFKKYVFFTITRRFDMKIYVYIVENRDVDYTNHKYSQSTHQTVLSSHCAPVFFLHSSLYFVDAVYVSKHNISYINEIALYMSFYNTIFFADTFLVLWL